MIGLGITAEDHSDVRLLEGLVDRVLVAQVDWIEPEVLDAYRIWCGLEGAAWLDLHRATARARERRLGGVYGHFDGEPGALDALMFRAVFLLFAAEDDPPAVVVVGRDSDGQATRRRLGFEQAAGRRWPFAAVLALPDPEMEAWLVATWSAEGAGDQAAHQAVRERLGFDPVLEPHRLRPILQQARLQASAGRALRARAFRSGALGDLGLGSCPPRRRDVRSHTLPGRPG